jgi:hypothetical protein
MKLGFVHSGRVRLARRTAFRQKLGGLVAVSSLVSGSVFLTFACDGNNGSGGGMGGMVDGSSGAPAADVAVAPTDGSDVSSTVRFVHLASNLGSVDFCLRSGSDETFVGPILGGGISADGGTRTDGAAHAQTDAEAGSSDAASMDADSTDGGSDAAVAAVDDALAPRTMTNYVSFEGSGTFDVAVVAAGVKSCASPLATLKVTLDPGKLATLALTGTYAGAAATADAGATDGGTSIDAGEPQSALRLIRLLDDPTSDAKQARVRMVNAAFGVASVPAATAMSVDVTGVQKTRIAFNVPLGAVAPQSAPSTTGGPVTDDLGYTLLTPVPPPHALEITGVGDASGLGTWTSLYTDLGLTAASLHTGFVMSDSADTLDVLWCTDTSSVGKRVDCRVIGKPAGDL